MKNQSFFNIYRAFWSIFSGVICLVVLTQCASKEVNPDDPDALFKDAEESFKDEKYLVALERYRDIKNRFPYSSRATDAELRIADTFYAQESYIEAESAYEIFKELHPTHPKADYVQYRIGMSYFQQIPSNSARDLAAAFRAIDSFNVLIDKYGNSEFVKEAKEHIKEARLKLAEHDNYVADFYFRKRHFLSASYRYAALLQDFSGLGYDEEGLFRLGKCYYQIRMYGNAKDALQRFLKQYPDSGLKGEASSILRELSEKANN